MGVVQTTTLVPLTRTIDTRSDIKVETQSKYETYFMFGLSGVDREGRGILLPLLPPGCLPYVLRVFGGFWRAL